MFRQPITTINQEPLLESKEAAADSKAVDSPIAFGENGVSFQKAKQTEQAVLNQIIGIELVLALFVSGNCTVNEIVLHLKNLHAKMQETLTCSRTLIEHLKS